MKERDEDAGGPDVDPSTRSDPAPEPDDERAAARRRVLERGEAGVADRLAARGRIRTQDRKRRRGFEVGEVVSKSLAAWFANFVPFNLLALGFTAPFIALSLWLFTRRPGSVHPRTLAALQVLDFAGRQLVGQLIAATLMFGVFQHLRRERFTIAQCLSHGLSRFLVVLGVAILVGAIVLPVIVGGSFVLALVAFLGGWSAAVALVGIPGAIVLAFVTATLFVAVPAAVVERPGVPGAIVRSFRLTYGSWLGILGVVLLMGLLTGLSACTPILLVEASVLVALGVQQLLLVLMSSLWAVTQAVTYHDLRVAKEGIASEELAAIFD